MENTNLKTHRNADEMTKSESEQFPSLLTLWYFEADLTIEKLEIVLKFKIKNCFLPPLSRHPLHNGGYGIGKKNNDKSCYGIG